MKATKFKFFDYRLDGGAVKPTSSFKLKFTITASPRMIAELLVANLKLKYPQYPWALGDCIDSEPVTVDFNHDFCFGVLAKFVDAFNTEWELDKYTLHVRKVERLDDNGNKITFKLSYGYDNGILGGISQTLFDNSRIVNRVYIEGGDRNIDRSTYFNDTLLLPKTTPITYEGVDYITDHSGSYLERATPLAGEEDSLNVSKVYPKRVGTVSAVEEIDDKKGFYCIIDNDIPADLDYSKMIIAGETMTIIFQTGQLAGREFDVKYIHAKRKFEIVPIDENGLLYPHGNLVPQAGDKYAVFHMRMPDSYITIAENEALDETVKYLWENEQAQYSYEWALDGIYALRNWGAISGYLNIGYFVEFSDPQFLPEAVDVRIIAVKELVNDPKSPEISIANKVSGKSLQAIINEIPAVEQTVDRKHNDAINFTKRRFRDSLETIKLLEEALLNFSQSINPITVQTMLALIGDESLQYIFIDSRDNPVPVPDGIVYADRQISIPVGVLQHKTLGIKEISATHRYKTWDMTAYVSGVFDEGMADSKYYLYAKVEKEGMAGTYLVSETAIVIDHQAGYYHLLVGVLNSEFEGERSFVKLYGFTEILPGRITTDAIVSSDNNFIIDLMRGLLEIINKNGKSMIKLDGSDGSGHLAGQNMQWDADSNITIRSNSSGKTIILDSTNRKIILDDGDTGTTATFSAWGWDRYGESELIFQIGDKSVEPRFYGLASYKRVGMAIKGMPDLLTRRKVDIALGTVTGETDPGIGLRQGLALISKDTKNDDRVQAAFRVYLDGEKLKISTEGLPQMDDPTSVLVIGDIYVDSNGFLKVAK